MIYSGVAFSLTLGVVEAVGICGCLVNFGSGDHVRLLYVSVPESKNRVVLPFI